MLITFIILAFVLSVVFACLVKEPMAFFVGIFFSCIVFIFTCFISSMFADIQLDQPIDNGSLIVEKSEFQYIIHVKSENGIVVSSIVISNVKDFNLVKSNDYVVRKQYIKDVFGFRNERSYKIFPKSESVEK